MAGISLFLVSYAVSSLWNLSYGIAGNLKAMAWMTLEFFLLYAGQERQDRTEHRKRDQREDPARGLVQVVILYTAVQAVISLGMLCAGYQGVSVERGMYIGLQEGAPVGRVLRSELRSGTGGICPWYCPWARPSGHPEKKSGCC